MLSNLWSPIMKKYNIFLSIIVVYILINMITFPQLYMQRTFDGLSAWACNVLPSILPFIFFTKVLSTTGLTEKISSLFEKPCKALYKTPSISSYVFFMSAISGYPIGAKITADLYTCGKITRSDAFKMTSFCSTSGPMFIIGAVGAGMLHSAKLGYIIFISHIAGALLNGIIYRKLKIKNDTKFTNNLELGHQKQDLGSIVIDSTLSVLSVGAIIAVFFVVITSFSPIFNIFPSSISSVLKGLIEITKGCIDISLLSNTTFKILTCAFVISFGGISTILQSLTMLNKLNMPVWLFVVQKLTHAIFATLICGLLYLMI